MLPRLLTLPLIACCGVATDAVRPNRDLAETSNPQARAGRFASDHLPVRATIRLQTATTAPSE